MRSYLAAFLPSFFSWRSSNVPTTTTTEEEMARAAKLMDELCGPDRIEPYLQELYPHDETLRCDGGYKVSAYPSTGGIIWSFLTDVEKRHLNIPVSSEKLPRSDDPDEEDELALQLLQMGGQWWPNPRLYVKHFVKVHGSPLRAFSFEFYGHHFPPRIFVGYPDDGGVWVLKMTEDEETEFSCFVPQVGPDDPDAIPPLSSEPEDWTRRINGAFTMEGRCQVIKDFGGNWYPSVQACPDLPDTLEEGVQRGKKYEARLRKMEDSTYSGKWLDFVAFRHITGTRERALTDDERAEYLELERMFCGRKENSE